MGRAAGDTARRGKRLISDVRLRTELELCDRWGIPHSVFRGIGDGTWTARDRAKALAYREYQRTVCPQCGTRDAEWDETAGGDENAYVAATHKCVGCEVIADKQAELPTEGQAARGMKVYLLPSAVHAALQAQRELTGRRHDDEDDDE